ncbi:hypothetical protein HI914_00446 [Erysiphe necator]|nr:hypothetical protein HI914_00446 [Erysiphe necator]
MSRDRKRSVTRSILHRSDSNASSSTKATKSLLKNSSSNVPASSKAAAAAAAAAMRSRPPTPVHVADVKTKRILRRKSSASTSGDRHTSLKESQTLRRSSSGSMYQRSFRDLSSTWSQVNMPPIPSLPDLIVQDMPKSKSVLKKNEALRTRKTSAQKLTIDSNARVESSGGPNISNYQYPIPSPSLSISRKSINFSLPTHSRPNSPIPQRLLNSQLIMNPASLFPLSNPKLVNDTNSIGKNPESESSVSKDPIDKIDKNLAVKENVAKSEIEKACLVTEDSPRKNSKKDQLAEDSTIMTKKTSTLPVKYLFMSKPSFFSSSKKSQSSKLEDTGEKIDNKNKYDFQCLKPFEFEKFTSNFSIDRYQLNHLKHDESQQNSSTSVEHEDNYFSTSLSPNVGELTSSAFSFPQAEESNEQDLDSKVNMNGQDFGNQNHCEQHHASDPCEENFPVKFNQNNDKTIENFSPLIHTTCYSMNPKSLAAINYLTHSTNHPCKSALKYSASPLNIGNCEGLSKVSIDESYQKKKVSKVSFDEKSSIVQKKSFTAYNSTTAAEDKKSLPCLNSSPETKKDENFLLRENEFVNLKPTLSSSGSVCGKNKAYQAEECRLFRPMEAVNYTLSPVSPLTHRTNSNFEMPDNDKIKPSSNNIMISNLTRDENLDSIAKLPISGDQLHNHINITKDKMRASDFYSSTFNTLRRSKSTGSLKTFTFQHIPKVKSIMPLNASKDSTNNTSETHLTFLESPSSSFFSQSSIKSTTSTSGTVSSKFDRLHIPGAWDFSNEDLDNSPVSNVETDISTENISYLIKNYSSENINTTHYSRKENRDNSLIVGLSQKDQSSYSTSQNLRLEEASEAGSVYCDALENISVIENFNFYSQNANSRNPTEYTDGDRLQATTKGYADELQFRVSVNSDANRTEMLPNFDVRRFLCEPVQDSFTMQTQKPIEDYRSLSSFPKSSSEFTVKNHAGILSKIESSTLHKIKAFCPKITIRREESRNSFSSYKRSRPINRESQFRSSMRKSIKPNEIKFRSSSTTFGWDNGRSSSINHTCNMRTKSKFHFSRIMNRHNISLPMDKNVINKQACRPLDTCYSHNLASPVSRIGLINSSNDDITNDLKLQINDAPRYSPKTSFLQKKLFKKLQ